VKESTLPEVIKANLAFLISYLIFLLVAGILIAVYPKADIHLYINSHTHGEADLLFRMITYLGDGITVTLITFLFLFYKFGSSLLIGISGLLAGIIVQVLKHTVFSSMVRPVKYFEGLHTLYTIPGVDSYAGNTFPSGHSASAFALCFCLAILVQNKGIKFLLFLLACTIGFSRVYLNQHFLNDIYAGSLVGIASVLFTCLLLQRLPPFSGAAWMHKRIGGKKSSVS
jgi:membrane-associated phospholipid phosphatase